MGVFLREDRNEIKVMFPFGVVGKMNVNSSMRYHMVRVQHCKIKTGHKHQLKGGLNTSNILVQMARMSPTAKYGCSDLQDVIKRSVRRRTSRAGRVASRRVSPCEGWRSRFNPTRRTGAFTYDLTKV